MSKNINYNNIQKTHPNENIKCFQYYTENVLQKIQEYLIVDGVDKDILSFQEAPDGSIDEYSTITIGNIVYLLQTHYNAAWEDYIVTFNIVGMIPNVLFDFPINNIKDINKLISKGKSIYKTFTGNIYNIINNCCQFYNSMNTRLYNEMDREYKNY